MRPAAAARPSWLRGFIAAATDGFINKMEGSIEPQCLYTSSAEAPAAGEEAKPGETGAVLSEAAASEVPEGAGGTGEVPGGEGPIERGE